MSSYDKHHMCLVLEHHISFLLESVLIKSLMIISYMDHTQNVLGKWSSKLFAIALLASGQSSTITGTYAGQYVMQVYRFPPQINAYLFICLHKRVLWVMFIIMNP